MWVFGPSPTSPQSWSKETVKSAYESLSATETTFLTMTKTPIPTIAVLSLVQGACDPYGHQSWTGPWKRVQGAQKIWTSDRKI